MVKASIFLAVHNKLSSLPNTLYSISRQKTSFPFEVCIVDDASDPDEYPFDVVDRMLPKVMWKFCRLNKNVGCKKSQIECLSIMDKDAEVIVLQSADVLYAGDDVLEKLVTETEPLVCTMAEVRNVFIPSDFHKHWDRLPYYLEEKRLDETLAEIKADPKQPERDLYTKKYTIFSGPRQVAPERRWFFFLGAIRTKDIHKTCFPRSCFDVDLSASLHREGFKVKYVDAIGLHQKHPLG